MKDKIPITNNKVINKFLFVNESMAITRNIRAANKPIEVIISPPINNTGTKIQTDILEKGKYVLFATPGKGNNKTGCNKNKYNSANIFPVS